MESFRPIDRDEVIVPKELTFPIVVKDYLAWLEPSGARVYLIFSDRPKSHPLGIVFRRDVTALVDPGHSLGMCEWCHSVRGGAKVGLLSATASSKKRIGLHLCNDLSCKDKLRNSPGVNDMPELLPRGERIKEVIGRMTHFARRELF